MKLFIRSCMTARRCLKIISAAIIIFALLTSVSLGQGSPPNILNVEVQKYYQGLPLKIEALITDDGEIGECLLYFRTPGSIEYDYVPFAEEYDRYAGEIPPDLLTGNGIEYYLYASDTEGNSRTYPEINPEQAPLRYNLVQEGAGAPTRVQLLSPEPSSVVDEGEGLIVISFFDPEDDTSPASIRLFVNGEDVTPKAHINKYIVTYAPEGGLQRGYYNVKVFVRDEAGNVTLPQEFNFRVARYKEKVERVAEYNLIFTNETIYDKYSGREQPSYKPVDHSKPRLKTWADWGWLRAEAEVFQNLYINEAARTNAENRQTLNRYRLKLETKPMTLIFGDANPRFSELTIKGTRIRGVTGEFDYKGVGLQGFYGETKQKIEPYIIGSGDSVLVDSIYNPTTDSTEYIYQFGVATPTYKREAYGARFSLDGGGAFSWLEQAELGFNYLRFTDDVSDSLEFVQDLISIGGYQLAEYDSLEMRYYLVQQGISPDSPEAEPYWERWAADHESVEGGLGKPKDNIVASATLDFRICGKTYLSFETALSILSENMFAERTLIDSSDNQNLLDMADYMEKNFDFKFNNEINPFFPKPVFYANLRTPLYYLPTDLTLNYRRIPSTYNSLGNPSIQTDINALKADTRTKLHGNKINLNLGGELKKNNLYNSKDQTTATSTGYTNIGLIFPKYPAVNLGFRLILRDGQGLAGTPNDTSYVYNPLTQEADTTYSYPDSTFTENITTTYTAAFSYGYVYRDWTGNANLNMMFMDYSDNKNSQYNFTNSSYMFSLGIISPYPVGLDLGLGKSFSSPSSGNQTVYTMFNSRLSYHFFNRKLTTFTGLEFLIGSRDADETYIYGIDNIKTSFKLGFTWKINLKTSLSLEGKAIDYSDDTNSPESSELSYTENRVRFYFNYRL